MATFKVGQRVRYVRKAPKKYKGFGIAPIGAEGTVVGGYRHSEYGDGYAVKLDLYPSDHPTGQFFCFADMLAPLLPPDEAADAFMARLKKLGSEPVNDAPKVTERDGK